MTSTPPVNGATRIRPGRRLALKQLLEMQQVLYASTTDPASKPLERASCARAWKELEEQKRILRGKLKPGSINARTDLPHSIQKSPSCKPTPEQIAALMREEQMR